MAEGGSVDIVTKIKEMQISPTQTYPMDRPKLGRAYIINNVASTHPGSMIDVKELRKTYEIMGFEVHTYVDCDNKKMREIKKEILKEETHEDNNCVMITIICHGNRKGELLDKNLEKAWILEDFVADLSIVDTLLGRPKILFVQSCRGGQAGEGKVMPNRFLATPDPEDAVIIPDKADWFIGFATVPEYTAEAGGETGSHYLQALANLLRGHYKEHTLDRIYLMVKQFVAKIEQGRQCSEERNSLRYLLQFSEHGTKTQVVQQVTMRHIKTHDTGFVYWGRTKFAVMPSTGDVALWGKTSDKDSPMLHVYKSSATSWEKYRSNSRFCEHDRKNILPVTIKNQELLAVSCPYCKKIRLYNMTSGEITTGFIDSRYYPGHMCHGDTGQIYVVHSVKGNPILQLNCSHQEFSISKTIQSGMEQYYAICYIPEHRLIAVSDNAPENIIRAVHCDTDEKAWEVAGTVSGKKCEPHEMVYSPDHDALLVADGPNTRVLVISPQDGSVRQVVQVSPDMKVIAELRLYKKQIVAWHHNDSKIYVSYFSLD